MELICFQSIAALRLNTGYSNLFIYLSLVLLSIALPDQPSVGARSRLNYYPHTTHCPLPTTH